MCRRTGTERLQGITYGGIRLQGYDSSASTHCSRAIGIPSFGFHENLVGVFF